VTVKRVGNQKHYQANASRDLRMRVLVLKTLFGRCAALRTRTAGTQIDVALVFVLLRRD